VEGNPTLLIKLGGNDVEQNRGHTAPRQAFA